MSTIGELQKKIVDVSAATGTHEQAIINGLIAHLEERYAPKNFSLEDSKIIRGIKKKIGDALYKMDGQKTVVNHATNYRDLFSLDEVEYKLVDAAWNQLEASGDVSSLKHEISMTEQGIRRYRNNEFGN